MKNKLMKKLKTVYNRDFSSGFFLGKPIDEWTKDYGNRAEPGSAPGDEGGGVSGGGGYGPGVGGEGQSAGYK